MEVGSRARNVSTAAGAGAMTMPLPWAPTGAQVVEFGVCNATIHKVNECVRIADVDRLSRTYERMMELLLAQ